MSATLVPLPYDAAAVAIFLATTHKGNTKIIQFGGCEYVYQFGRWHIRVSGPKIRGLRPDFPRAFEATSYDTSQLGVFHWAVVTGGTIAEFVLPLLIVVGLLTRLSAIGMIEFIIV